MAALREPNEEAVGVFLGVTSLQRSDALRWLKAHNNDANLAVNAYFENPDAILDQQSQVRSDEQRGQLGWNEGFFHGDTADHAQEGQNHVGVRPSDTLRPGVFNDSTPTRPPSRVSTRGTTAANQNVAEGSEDDEMMQALTLSLENQPDRDSRAPGGRSFGPATRLEYETEKWAMTLSGSPAEEVLLNPDPVERKRPKDFPAFFKPSPAGHRLPALLKILHAVPMAREALLNRSYMLPDYGHDKDWWDGTAIRHLRIVNLDSEGQKIDDDDILYETQRLMAFLDETKRAYGSVDALANVRNICRYNNNKIVDFLNEWRNATVRAVPDAPLVNIFESRGVKIRREEPERTEHEPLSVIELFVDDEIAGKDATLYEVLDELLWMNSGADDEVFLSNVGEVITFEVQNQVTKVAGLGIEIPATFYADRYLQSSTKQIQDMLSRKNQVLATLKSKEMAHEKLTTFSKGGNGVTIDAAHLLSRATAYFEQTAAYRTPDQDHSGVVEDCQSSNQGSRSPAQVAKELATLAERISHKLKAFESVRDNARKEIKQISQMYTKASDDPTQPPHHKYTLRGVSTTPNVVYVLEKTKPEDEDDILSTAAKDWQWWRIAFTVNETKPVVRIKVKEQYVLKAASTESSNCLLVYASVRATSCRSEDLAQQLHNFVRTDNLFFSKELDESSSPIPTTPTKRKVDDNDSDDLETHSHRSPPRDRALIDTAGSYNDTNFDPPQYQPHPTSPLKSHQRAHSHKSTTVGSFDDLIPASLQNIGPTSRASEGQEMQERSSGKNLLHQRKGSKGEYGLGNYVPEINMVDDDEDEDQRGVKGG